MATRIAAPFFPDQVSLPFLIWSVTDIADFSNPAGSWFLRS
jgi:hypothetical protein